MSSRSRPAVRVTLILSLAASALAGCERERRDLAAGPQESAPRVQTTTLTPGPGQALPKDPRAALYENSAYHVSEGARLFRWYNCNGCHANGGGGMGPALIDDEWRYGSEMEQLYGTIAQGRPNGMPAFQGKATDEQIWELAAYVRSLSGLNPKTASSRRDAMTSTPPRNQATPGEGAGSNAASVQGTSG